MIRKVGIIEYGLGNIHSLKQACLKLGFDAVLINNKQDLEKVDKIILPGVGSFKTAVQNLKKLDLFEPIKTSCTEGKQILGICLGMQLLMETSIEFGISKGLGIFKGTTKSFKDNQLLTPNIGWNNISKIKDSSILNNVNFEKELYFVHSFHVVPEDKNDILLNTNYNGFEYCAAINRNNIYGFQFHPEKSGETGLSLLKNFLTN